MTNQVEIRFVGDLERLQIGPEDKFVLTIDGAISCAVAHAIKEQWAAFAGPDTPLLILEKGAKLGAINVRVEQGGE